jgi:peptidoglycan hydrolase CwlO-like protein
MEAMRESWTDDRLDYLNHRVDDGFKHVDERFDRFEKHVDERFNRFEKHVDERIEETNRRMERLESQIEKLNQGFVEWSASSALTTRALIVTVAIGFLTVLATHG